MDEITVNYERAREAVQRLINSHFGNDNRARCSIPADPKNDDDLIVSGYVEKSERIIRKLLEEKADHQRVVQQLREEIADEEQEHERTIVQRDDAEETIAKIYTTVTNCECVWSNLFGYNEALNGIAEVVSTLRAQVERLSKPVSWDELDAAAKSASTRGTVEVFDAVIAFRKEQP